jgi:hypothetical protein
MKEKIKTFFHTGKVKVLTLIPVLMMACTQKVEASSYIKSKSGFSIDTVVEAIEH